MIDVTQPAGHGPRRLLLSGDTVRQGDINLTVEVARVHWELTASPRPAPAGAAWSV